MPCQGLPYQGCRKNFSQGTQSISRWNNDFPLGKVVWLILVVTPDETDASAAKPSERPFALRGMPRAPGGVTDLSRDAMPRHLNVRISDGELEALDRSSAEMGCSRSRVI